MNIPYEQLQAYCKGLLSAAGMSAADADIVAKVLAVASLEGVDTHGENGEKRERQGIPVSQALIDELNQFAAKWHVKPLRF